jgi:hypothetical protein
MQSWLTTLATIKTELGITGTTHDDQLSRMIAAASASIASYCGRRFDRDTAIAESVAGYGLDTIVLARLPVNHVISIGGEVADVMIDASIGIISRLGGFAWTAQLASGASVSPMPGTEYPSIEVVYDGGFVMPSQAASASTVTLTFAATSPATITRSAGSWITSGFAERLPVTITGSASNDGVYRVDSVSATVLTLAGDHELIAEVATPGCSAEIVRDFPYDLEDACIQMIRTAWAGRYRDPSVSSERLLSWSASYSSMPRGVSNILNRYRLLA